MGRKDPRPRPSRLFPRVAAIGMLALAAVFLLATDQDTLLGGAVLRKSGVLLRSGSMPGLIGADGYDRVLRRALASTDDISDAAREERIVHRALEARPSRTLSADNRNYEVIRAAQKIRENNDNSDAPAPFLFVMQATVGMIPMVKSWICNTETMEGVHENTLLILDEAGKEILEDFPPAKGMHIVLDPIPENLRRSFGFRSLGYWLLTQNRFHTILDIIDLGKVPVMIIEPDAVWLENPLDDPQIADSDADIVGFTDGGPGGDIGFGFLRMNPTDTVINLLHLAGESVDETLKAAVEKVHGDPTAKADDFITAGEQGFFTALIKSFVKEHPDKNFLDLLPQCRYPSGLWYQGADQSNKDTPNEKCRKEGAGSVVVIQNNWMIGNKFKIARAKEWGHWFLTDKEVQCVRTDLKIARQAVETETKPGIEMIDLASK
jgi:hypothetical protein